MSRPEAFCREAGTGTGVVCLHSNASSSAQWRGLMERLAPRFHVLAPDSYGAGKSPEWPSDRVITLADEVALINPESVKNQIQFMRNLKDDLRDFSSPFNASQGICG